MSTNLMRAILLMLRIAKHFGLSACPVVQVLPAAPANPRTS